MAGVPTAAPSSCDGCSRFRTLGQDLTMILVVCKGRGRHYDRNSRAPLTGMGARCVAAATRSALHRVALDMGRSRRRRFVGHRGESCRVAYNAIGRDSSRARRVDRRHRRRCHPVLPDRLTRCDGTRGVSKAPRLTWLVIDATNGTERLRRLSSSAWVPRSSVASRAEGRQRSRGPAI